VLERPQPPVVCNKVVSYGARGSEKGAIDALGRENVDYVLSAVWWNAQLGNRPGVADGTDLCESRSHVRLHVQFTLQQEAANIFFMVTPISHEGSLAEQRLPDVL